MTTAVYHSYLPFKGYHYNDTNSSTTAENKAFLNLIARSIKADSKKRVAVKNSSGTTIGYMTQYALTTSYSKYDANTRNCFTALGLWVSALGDNRFTAFAQSHPYTDYTAYNIVNTLSYAKLWDLQGTYTSY